MNTTELKTQLDLIKELGINLAIINGNVNAEKHFYQIIYDGNNEFQVCFGDGYGDNRIEYSEYIYLQDLEIPFDDILEKRKSYIKLKERLEIERKETIELEKYILQESKDLETYIKLKEKFKDK